MLGASSGPEFEGGGGKVTARRSGSAALEVDGRHYLQRHVAPVDRQGSKVFRTGTASLCVSVPFVVPASWWFPLQFLIYLDT